MVSVIPNTSLRVVVAEGLDLHTDLESPVRFSLVINCSLADAYTCHCIEKCCCITGFSPAQYSSCLLFVKRERTELEAALVRFGDKIEWLCSHILDGLTGNALKLFSIRAVIYRHRYQSCTLISKAPELRFSIPTQGSE